MGDELTAESGLDALIALLDERGIEHYECVASECEATVYEDKAGNAHECWEGGTSGIVNVVIAVTPEDALSVGDLNGVICENAKLKSTLAQYRLFEDIIGDPADEFAALRRRMHALERENGRLRDLVHELKRHVCRLHRDEPCAVICGGYDDGLHCCGYELQMRELGIEAR